MENTQMAWIAAAIMDGRARRVEYFVASSPVGALASSLERFDSSKEDMLLTPVRSDLSVR